MSIWKTLTIEERPHIILTRWRIFEVWSENEDPTTRHFVGYNCRDSEGRVSSAITTFDRDSLTGITDSGRIYKLSGESGYDPDAEYVWGRWVSINRISEFREIGIGDL